MTVDERLVITRKLGWRASFVRSSEWPWLIAALVGGLVVGWLDRSATEVQGPLLLLMAVAVFAAMPRRAPGWAIAIATTAGLLLAHVVGGIEMAAGAKRFDCGEEDD